MVFYLLSLKLEWERETTFLKTNLNPGEKVEKK